MKKTTTQEILGTPNFHSNVISYLLTTSFIPENEEKQKEDSVTLLIGSLIEKKECDRSIKKFIPFFELPLFCKEDAKELWIGKFHEVKEFKTKE